MFGGAINMKINTDPPCFDGTVSLWRLNVSCSRSVVIQLYGQTVPPVVCEHRTDWEARPCTALSRASSWVRNTILEDTADVDGVFNLYMFDVSSDKLIGLFSLLSRDFVSLVLDLV